MKKKILLFFIILATCHPVPSRTLAHEGYTPEELLKWYTFERVVDGDTLKVVNEAMPSIFKRMSIRVRGLDSPELRGKCKKEKQLALRSKDFAVLLFKNAEKIEFRNMTPGKFYRIVADVYIDDVSFANTMIFNDHARTYDAKKRNSWCG